MKREVLITNKNAITANPINICTSNVPSTPNNMHMYIPATQETTAIRVGKYKNVWNHPNAHANDLL